MKTSIVGIVVFLVSYFLLFNSIVESHESPIHRFLKCAATSNTLIPISKNEIHHPESPTFFSTLRPYIRNERFNRTTTPKPILIVTAKHENHVQLTVSCAKKHGIQIRIRSGGHDYEGLSYSGPTPFILLDMSSLRSIDIDLKNETAWAYAGATLGELYYKIANTSKTLAFPAGVCHTLGLGGHISGGGYGNLIRKYGISADHVIDAKVVTADGFLHDRRSMGEDLFWAIRGGGAASFAVVVAWKLQLVHVPEIVTVFNVGRTLEEGATDIVVQWQNFAPKADKNLFIRLQPEVVNGIENVTKTIRVSFIAQYLGPATELVKYLDKSFPLLRLQQKDCLEQPWVKTTQFWFGQNANTPVDALLDRGGFKYFCKFRSDYVQHPIPKAGLEAIWRKMIELEVMYMQWNPYGGRVGEIAEDALPFPHRAGNLFKIQYNGMWFEDGAVTENRVINASTHLYDAMTPYVSKNPREHFLNYRDIDVGTNKNGSLEFANGYFKNNLPRLLKTKVQVDPDNFFRYEQSIPLVVGY